MLSITLLCVGRIKEKSMAILIEEYKKRLSSYCRMNIVEVPDEKCPEGLSPKDKELVLDREGKKLLSKIPENSWIVPLEIEGNSLSSTEWSKKMEDWQVQGKSHICFIIGGSLGLHSEIKKRSHFSLSFSPMTFPHQLTRLMLLEQIYRAFRIQRNEPYHK